MSARLAALEAARGGAMQLRRRLDEAEGSCGARWTFGADAEGPGAMRGTRDALRAVCEPIPPAVAAGSRASPTPASATAPSLKRLDAGPAAGFGICKRLSMFCRFASRRAVSSDLTEVVDVAEAVDRSAEAQADESSTIIESSTGRKGVGAGGGAVAGRATADVEAAGRRSSASTGVSSAREGLDGRGKRLVDAKAGAALEAAAGRGLTAKSMVFGVPSVVTVAVAGRATSVLDIGIEVAGAAKFGSPNALPAVRCIGTDDGRVREGWGAVRGTDGACAGMVGRRFLGGGLRGRAGLFCWLGPTFSNTGAVASVAKSSVRGATGEGPAK